MQCQQLTTVGAMTSADVLLQYEVRAVQMVRAFVRHTLIPCADCRSSNNCKNNDNEATEQPHLLSVQTQ